MKRRGWIVLGLLLGAGCASPTKDTRSPLQIVLAREASRAAELAREHRFTEAVLLYERGLAKARARDLPVSVGTFAYNLARCHTELKQYDMAWRYVREARAEFLRTGAYPYEMLLLTVRITYEEGDLVGAEKLLSRNLAASAPSALPSHLLLTRIRLDLKDFAGAAKSLGKAEEYARRNEAVPGDLALLSRLRGDLALHGKDVAAAAGHYDFETDVLREAGSLGLSRAMARAADAWEKAGKPVEAFDRYYRAARSAFAQGMEKDAWDWMLSARELAKQLSDAERIQRATDLFQEIAVGADTPE